jgi:hypothetical protein
VEQLSADKFAKPRSRRPDQKADSCSRFHNSVGSHSDRQPARGAQPRAQATDSASRSREEITVETPSPRMLIPYKASAISIVRF